MNDLFTTGAVAFVFSSQGGEWPGMADGLLLDNAAFAKAMADCDAACRHQFGWSILEEVSRLGGSDAEPDRVQPVLTAVQIGLAAMLADAGVAPDAVVGLSMGELAAAWSIGSLSLEDAIAVAGAEAEAIRRPLRSGQMALVLASAEAVRETIDGRDDVWIAVELSPTATVITGEEGAVDSALAVVAARGLGTRRQTLRYAFHCAEMEPLREPFRAAASSILPRSAPAPFYSSLKGAAIDGSRLTIDYWWRVMSEPALFVSAVRSMARAGIRTFVEVGPHPILSTAVTEAAGGAAVLPTMSAHDDSSSVLEAIERIAYKA